MCEVGESVSSRVQPLLLKTNLNFYQGLVGRVQTPGEGQVGEGTDPW